jgi:glycosyltransferase involved in cell wall biosynthesis
MARVTDSLSFALLVATRGRRHELVRLFDSLTRQTYSKFTLYIGDQNAPGFLDDILGLYADSLLINHFTIQPSGLSRARNALLPQVREDIVAVPDDDCWYQPDTLERCAAVFAGSPHIDALIGQWTDKRRRTDTSLNAGTRDRRIVKTRYGLFHNAASITLFFRKRVFAALRFDENIGIGSFSRFQSGEETDLLLRAQQAGFVTARAPSVVVRHDNSVADDPETLKKVRCYSAGRMALLRKHDLPLWFQLVNLAYPLAVLPLGCAFECLREARYRWTMFSGRAAELRADGAL